MNTKFNNTLVMFAIIASVALVVLLVVIGIFIVDTADAKAVVVNRGFDLAALVISGILAKVVLGSVEKGKEILKVEDEKN